MRAASRTASAAPLASPESGSPRKAREGRTAVDAQPLGVGQTRAQRARLFDLRRVELGLVDLRALKAQEIESLLPIPRRFEQTGALRVELTQCAVGLAHGFALGLEPARGVEQPPVELALAQRLRIVLTRDLEASSEEIAQGRKGDQLTRDARAAPTRRRERSVDDELVGVAQQAAALEIGLEISGVFGAEHALDRGLGGPFALVLRGSSCAGEQPESTEYDRLPGTGLAGEDVQARLELERGLVHDREPTNPKSLDHLIPYDAVASPSRLTSSPDGSPHRAN